jgi:hypothetical protein
MKKHMVTRLFLVVFVAVLTSVCEGQSIAPRMGWFRLAQPSRPGYDAGYDSVLVHVHHSDLLPVHIDTIKFSLAIREMMLGIGCVSMRVTGWSSFHPGLSIDPVTNRFTSNPDECSGRRTYKGLMLSSETMTLTVLFCGSSMTCRDTIVFKMLVTDIKGRYAVQDMPKGFLLEQNYPNPFNPMTTISYQIPKLSFVTIKISDPLGREIASLVNEVKYAGTYTVQWNAYGQPSGMYFYRLQAGSYTETKRLTLIK